MSKRIRQSINDEIQVKVIAQTRDHGLGMVWYLTLAAIFAGVFYFWGYYFWAFLGRVLAGG